jgi:hypothetical protein
MAHNTLNSLIHKNAIKTLKMELLFAIACNDSKEAHKVADDAIIDFLITLEYKEIVDLYKQVEKQY